MKKSELRQLIREEIQLMLNELDIKYKIPNTFSDKYLKLIDILGNKVAYNGKNKRGDFVIGVNYRDRQILIKHLNKMGIKWQEII